LFAKAGIMMDTTLDSLASQAVFTAHRFERAVHDRGPWSMTWAGHSAAARRVKGTSSVTFSAQFPSAPVPGAPTDVVALTCAGQTVGVRPVTSPISGPFVIRWAIEGSLVGASF